MSAVRALQNSPTLDSGAVEAIKRRMRREAGQGTSKSLAAQRRMLNRRLYESYATNPGRMCVFREDVLRRLKSENADARFAALRRINERDALLEIVMDEEEGCISSGFPRDLKGAAAEKLRGMAAEKDIIAWIVLENHAKTIDERKDAFEKVVRLIGDNCDWRRQVNFGTNERALLEVVKWCEKHRKLMDPPAEDSEQRQVKPAIKVGAQQELRELCEEHPKPVGPAELSEKFRLFFGAVKIVYGWQLQCVRDL